MKCNEIAKTVLLELAALKFTSGFSVDIVNVAKELGNKQDSAEWCEIVKCVMIGLTSFFKTCDKFLTLSDLREAFLRSSASYSINMNERIKLVKLMQSLTSISKENSNLFFGLFLRNFSSHLLAYFIHFMLHDGEDSSLAIPLTDTFYVSSQPTETLDFKQLMHFIGGSNVRSVLRTAFRIKNPSSEWVRVIDTIRNYFIIGELASAPDEELMQWTEDQDRGGLIKIGSDLLDFFVELGVTVNVLEHFDGSLYIDEVIEKVTNNGKLIRLWDEAIRGSLPGDESFKLLHALCSHFCITWRRGIITRRIDELSTVGKSVGGSKHGQSGVAFRSTLQ